MNKKLLNFEKSAFVRGCLLNFNPVERNFYFKVCLFGNPKKEPSFLDYCESLEFECFRYRNFSVPVDDPELDLEFLDEALQDAFNVWKRDYLIAEEK